MGIFGGSNIGKGLDDFHATPGAVLIDVRSEGEYAGGHIPGSINVPLDRIQSIDVPKETPLFVYCASGARSSSACSWLNGNGYDAVNIGGLMGYHGELE